MCTSACRLDSSHRGSRSRNDANSTWIALLSTTLKSSNYDLLAGGILFREAKFLLDTQFISFDANYVPRSRNNCAHELACYGLSRDSDQSFLWVDPLLEFVITLADRELQDPLGRNKVASLWFKKRQRQHNRWWLCKTNGLCKYYELLLLVKVTFSFCGHANVQYYGSWSNTRYLF
jgi:hypothetical protein